MFVLGIMFILAGFLVTFISLADGSGVNLGVLMLVGQLIVAALVSLFIGIKLTGSKKWRKIMGVIIIVFGVLFGVNLLMSMFYITKRSEGMPLAFGIISFSMCLCGALIYINTKDSISK